jgi:hypothetical protein
LKNSRCFDVIEEFLSFKIVSSLEDLKEMNTSNKEGFVVLQGMLGENNPPFSSPP